MRYIQKRGRFIALLLASSLSMLAVAQFARPLVDLASFDVPGAANVHQKLTRHSVEQVGEEEIEFSDPPEDRTSSQDESGSKFRCSEPVFETIEAKPSLALFHRKLLPPSPNDYY